MELKKNPKVDLRRNSGVYFSFGLCLMLFLTWRALEMKTYEKQTFDAEEFIAQQEPEEDIPIVDLKNLPPPPPPPAAPVLIEVIEDDSEIVETIIESTETSQDEVIAESELVNVDDVEVEEEEEDVVVPFAVIEQVAAFPGCDGLPKADQRKCFNEMMNKHIQKHFRYPDVAKELGIQGRVYVQFVVDRKGNVSNIRMRGPDRTLEKEAKRIISLLPKFVPGEQRGKPVSMGFSIPITFKLMNS